ncbi:head morphogenesis protein SPP1 [Rhizobium sp. LC145]|uniref:head morphogenesis protein SPP1 n=1 Tax=Rhizobium sp. LC145 TaxID=1120688 RepID=UPI00062A2B4F|nr:head morphogenesis protein SPP1 [Rhizobium sp. LC145]KKX29184.1 head morphogenesis protein SPP1 [Rhizobium sp. LC145]TKT42791.1 head morphogenesis protein [Rhizobiaceae bacterium LC148]
MTFDELLDRYEPRLAAAFREGVEAIKSTIVLKTVVERLERGDIAGAIRAIQFEPEAFSALEIALQEAFNAGGVNMVQSLPQLVAPDGTRVLFQFGVRNLEAERLIREQSSTLVTNIVEDQREALRIAFEAGLAQGRNPTATALEVVGRVNRVTGRREGGVIGLTSRQAEFITRARESLLSGNLDGMRSYLALKTRDRRFDRTVLKAIREDRPVDRELVAKIIGRLSDRNLLLRAETIALEETRTALFSVRDNAIRQQIEGGKIAAQEVTKKWRHSGSEHPRLQHIAMSGQSVGIDQPFVAPDGTHLMYPHDPKAPVRHRIGCKCRVEYDIDYIAAGLRRYRARAA